jgi:hypothetical protein
MPANQYHFVTRWQVRGTAEEVWAVLNDPLSLPRWWPSVYLSVVRKPGDVYELHTRGRLPYTLRWSFRVSESEPPRRLGLEAWGDFEGRGMWTFSQQAEFTNIEYDWRIRAEKALLRYGSFLLKPIFAANHRWAMARGEESLRAELDRRRKL